MLDRRYRRAAARRGERDRLDQLVGRPPVEIRSQGKALVFMAADGNPSDLFPVIYLGLPVDTCMRELARAADDNHLDVATLLLVPYKLHTIRVNDIPVLDLRSDENRDALGLNRDDLVGPWETCQPTGHAAWFLEFAGVLAPSATAANGLTLALFEHRVLPDRLHVEASDPLTMDLYRAHSS